MKPFVFLLLCCLVNIGLAQATIDPDQNKIGVYFDQAAEVNALPAQANSVPFNVYVCITNPSEAEIHGLEFGYNIVVPAGMEGMIFRLANNLPAGSVDIGNNANILTGDYVTGLASPLPGAASVPFVSWTFMILVPGLSMDFYITESAIPSLPEGGPAYEAGGYVVGLCQSSGDPGRPCGSVNSIAPVVAACGTTPPPPPSLDPINISIDIDVRAGGMYDNDNIAGTDSLATFGYDGDFDVPQPGPPPANYVVASFRHPEWPLGPRFQTDIRRSYTLDKEVKTWPLMVETDIEGPVVMQFTTSFTPDIKVRFSLRDLQTGVVHDMLGVPTYTFDNIGENVYQFELIVENIRPLPLAPVERGLPADWVLVGLPVATGPSYDTVGEVLFDQAPGASYAYGSGGSSGYGLVAAGTTWDQGDGYWFASSEPFTWSVPGERDLDGTLVALNDGWNIVGAPVWFAAPREGIMVRHQGAEYTWNDAATQGLVAAAVMGFDSATGAYVNTDTLRAWNGYWISALQPGVDLWFDWPVFDELTNPVAKVRDAFDIRKSWQTTLSMSGADKLTRQVVLGVRPEATDGFDARFDAPRPPASPKGGPRFGVQHPDWKLSCGDFFSEDYVSPDAAQFAWSTRITLEEPGTVSLTWDNLNWPAGLDLQMYSPAENRVIVASMRDQNRLRLTLSTSSFDIVVRSPVEASAVEDLPGMEYRIGVHPNPFNPMTTISFDLPRTVRADVNIYTVRGELVTTLGGETFGAGHHEFVWNGTDSQGRQVPSGSYFARLQADGQDIGHVTKMSLVR